MTVLGPPLRASVSFPAYQLENQLHTLVLLQQQDIDRSSWRKAASAVMRGYDVTARGLIESGPLWRRTGTAELQHGREACLEVQALTQAAGLQSTASLGNPCTNMRNTALG